MPWCFNNNHFSAPPWLEVSTTESNIFDHAQDLLSWDLTEPEMLIKGSIKHFQRHLKPPPQEACTADDTQTTHLLPRCSLTPLTSTTDCGLLVLLLQHPETVGSGVSDDTHANFHHRLKSLSLHLCKLRATSVLLQQGLPLAAQRTKSFSLETSHLLVLCTIP